jgi:hypothetical protein
MDTIIPTKTAEFRKLFKNEKINFELFTKNKSITNDKINPINI